MKSDEQVFWDAIETEKKRHGSALEEIRNAAENVWSKCLSGNFDLSLSDDLKVFIFDTEDPSDLPVATLDLTEINEDRVAEPEIIAANLRRLADKIEGK